MPLFAYGATRSDYRRTLFVTQSCIDINEMRAFARATRRKRTSIVSVASWSTDYPMRNVYRSAYHFNSNATECRVLFIPFAFLLLIK